MQDIILSIAGRQGLYRLISRGSGRIIVEALDETKKRFPASPRDRITSLNDVSMYTDADDIPLMEVFQNIANNLQGKPSALSHKTATAEELKDFMQTALPDYDRERVHQSDMKKLLQWYNLLIAAGYTTFVEEEQAESAEDTPTEA
ncbi:MAG: DUF5606 domain-containing protein [Bacteroidaceae bacterium]|nr:DUF5606 domain-containing protein [Bacteroidaceae bacterium]